LFCTSEEEPDAPLYGSLAKLASTSNEPDKHSSLFPEALLMEGKRFERFRDV
jgi:hypothetical protein